MTTGDELLDLTAIEGFAGAALFSAAGDLLAACGGDAQLEAAGRVAADVLLSAKRASAGIGAGRGHQVHVAGERAHVLVRCLNEGTDPLRAQPGKAHLHLVVVLAPDASVPLAEARMASRLRALAERFRA
jgi:predicted regulator of Ras-like GTPase activity (Roadblock/LC7/MglB family)